MTFEFLCSHCGRSLKAEEEWDGMMTACPFCGREVKITRPVFNTGGVPGTGTAPAVESKPNTIALVGFILSLVSVVFCCGFDFGTMGLTIPGSVLVSVAGGVCSFIGYRQSREKNFLVSYDKLALAGIIIAAAGVVLRILWGIVAIVVVAADSAS